MVTTWSPTCDRRSCATYVERRPFGPFRICLSDGSERELAEPGLIFLTTNNVILCRMSDGEELPETKKRIAPRHITRLEVVGRA